MSSGTLSIAAPSIFSELRLMKAILLAKFVLIGTLLVVAFKWIVRLAWRAGPFLASLVFFISFVFLAAFALLDTRRDVAYRYSGPGSDECVAQQLPANSTILANESIDNDELKAVRQIVHDNPKQKDVFTCMLQLHAMRPGFVPENPDKAAGNPSLGYYLSFLEFEENGNPVQLGSHHKVLAQPQIDALMEHLNRQTKAGRQNFVFAFVHGWRHDARVGDDNVKNVRLMAAHLTSFLEQRCRSNSRYCGATVTAVYIGWRGARVDEARLGWLLGGYFADTTATINNFIASMTLFDRKPVSERIAPTVISALQAIDRAIRIKDDHSTWFEQPRLIVIGHSLGGNLLATGVKDDMIAITARHLDELQKARDTSRTDQKAPLVKPPFGDLIVLLNPASEAEKWIALQRAFRQRLGAEVDSRAVHDAYSEFQPPIYMSLTAARSWPANGIHPADVASFEKHRGIDPKQQANPCSVIRLLDGDYRPSYEYDSATYDLFPFFKFDFRPLAQTIEDWSNPNPYDCDGKNDADVPKRPGVVLGTLWKELAAALRNAPFMNTDIEQTRTIGHVDPMRPAYGLLYGRENDPATWTGTTHEFLINSLVRQKPPGEESDLTLTAHYIDAGSPEKSECAVVDKWLSTVRTDVKYSHPQREGGAFVNWDSGWSRIRSGKVVPGEPGKPNLTGIRLRPDNPVENIEGQFRQTLYFGGMRSITGANDPFWNVRAFQSAMTNHDGYVSYPLICSIFQFVMDKITDDAVPVPKSTP
jgi:hypothetical protein